MKLFGTDGIRGRPGEEPLTEETLNRLGRILAGQILNGETGGEARAILGHDGRESGETLGAALADGLVRGGVGVDVVGLAPTPALAYLTAAGDYAAGVVISASHNPATDNGVKLLGPDGSKLSDQREAALEEELLSVGALPDAEKPGEMRRTKRITSDYIAWMRNEAFPDLDLGGWQVLMDCANGAYSELGPRILKSFGADATVVSNKPDGHNINANCGAMFPERAVARMQEHGSDIGLVLDGDGDRGLLVDPTGRILDGDVLLAGLGAHLQGAGALPGSTVIATVMSNMGLERFLEPHGVSVERVPVGDRNVVAGMRERGFALGGEKSGHLLFGAEHGYRGDGVYTFLKTAQAMLKDGTRPPEFASGFRELPQELRNLRVTRMATLEDLPHLRKTIGAVQKELGGSGRVVVRFSGTEPLLRLMAEAETAGAVTAALDRLEAAAGDDGALG